MGYLVAAYLIFWSVIFFYILYLARRQRAIEERMDRLQARLNPDLWEEHDEL
ncbi:MAG: CcmD family protein [Anaerolineae bacterium]|nr:CcmD family protein [Thermoflexus sp.]MDW8065726.1 CcmD family protein [Anaerolineae bacterium]